VQGGVPTCTPINLATIVSFTAYGVLILLGTIEIIKFVISGCFDLLSDPSGLLFTSFDDVPLEGLGQLRKNKEMQNNINM
jgi:hypothetical protein